MLIEKGCCYSQEKFGFMAGIGLIWKLMEYTNVTVRMHP